MFGLETGERWAPAGASMSLACGGFLASSALVGPNLALTTSVPEWLSNKVDQWFKAH